MNGKVCVVTGANSGIGRVMATDFARRGAKVLLVCRNEAKGKEALEAMRRETGSQDVRLLLCDVGSQRAVREVSKRLAEERRIDVLVNNAGVFLPEREVTEDGHEAMIAINHLGPFLMTNLLLDRMTGGRVVTVSSMAHRMGKLDLDDLDAERRFNAWRQYGISKLCNILFTRELARRGAARGIVASCFHPGAVATGFAQDAPGYMNHVMRLGRAFLRTPEKGAETGIYLATAPEAAAENGQFFIDRKVRGTSRQGRDDALAAALWKRSEELTGIA
jgi:NAD(P)-dependent dehydrogenase (short-subunit alcohol dehydrogenase family)